MLALYRIVNVTNGKFYVGSSIVVKTRLRTHRRDLRNGGHHCSYLQRAWNKYGEESFKFEIIEYFDDKVLLLEAEDRWLSVHQGQSHCYNTGRTAKASFLGRTHTDETKAKVSAAQKGKQHRLGHTNSLAAISGGYNRIVRGLFDSVAIDEKAAHPVRVFGQCHDYSPCDVQ